MKTEATTQPTRPTDLVPLWKALLSLDINENTFSAACRTREWLNPVREVHAETGKMWALWHDGERVTGRRAFGADGQRALSKSSMNERSAGE